MAPSVPACFSACQVPDSNRIQIARFASPPRNMRAMNLKSLLAGLFLSFVAISAWYGVIAGPAGAGLMAKQVCSLIHVSGFTAERAMDTYIRPLLGPAVHVMSLRTDPVRRQVVVTALGFRQSTAVHHPGYGCIQLHDRSVADIEQLLPPRPPMAAEPWEPDPQHRRQYFDVTALHGAADAVFSAPGTLALLMVHQGHVVIERYAEGINGTTPLPGWSMAKTVTALAAGMLARRQFLGADEVALFKPWEEDERIHISLDQLLRMTSGINILENTTGADANSTMLFKTGDSSTYAINRGLDDTPGEVFAYTSGSTMLAARLISDRLGGHPETLGFLRRELFESLGMNSTYMEPDETGQFIGSSFIMSSAHDWARLGLMLLNDGEDSGTRYVDESWIEYMTTPTPQATHRPYGAGVWLIDPDHPIQHWMHKLPRGTYYASGLQTNQLWVMPEQELIVVRLGATNDFFKSGVAEFLVAVLAAQMDPEIQSST
ncbi:MAG: serine hydrolase [Gammaproteobacteria bacterium]|nr:serine hydrolase [Gammaproteobacteria bacterium]